jgi:hypothetical protein
MPVDNVPAPDEIGRIMQGMSAPFAMAGHDPVDVLKREQMLFLGEPFSSAEAHAAGLSRKVLRRMVREGTLRLVLKGAYVDAAAEDTLGVRAAAAAKVVPAGSVVCDRTAAWLHGADILGPEGRLTVPPLDLFRLAGGSRVRRPECTGGTRTLCEDDVMRLRGVLVTTPLRTALDLGRFLPRANAMAAIDALTRAGGLTKTDLQRELPRFRGQRGVVQLRTLTPLTDPRSESPAESVVRLQIVDAGLPIPEVQWEVRAPGGFSVYRLDLAYPALRLAIEYDGEEFHTAEADRRHDERRRARLRRMGWTIIVLRKEQVYSAYPQTGDIVRAAIEAATAAVA